MILVLRGVFGVLLIAGMLCFAAFAFSGQPVWRQRGVRIVKWTLIGAGGLAAAILLPRLLLLL